MSESKFFEHQTISSKIKAEIVSNYFPKYCNIIVTKHKPKQLRYIDLFAGPGIYEDGSESTPILIARNCLYNQYLRDNVWFIFNDMEHCNTLKSNFMEQFPEGTFKISPFFNNLKVGEAHRITDFLVKSTMINGRNESPSVLFIDPFGYKGIETKVLAEFLKNWGNEIFLFVNTKRIHPALENDKFEDLMKQLFPTQLEKIKVDRRYKSTVIERLNLIIDALGEEYKILLDTNNLFYTAFKFQEEDSDGTSHYILHFTKGVRGFDLIKTIYNDFANVGTFFDGKNTYTFDAKKYGKDVVELFDQNAENIKQLKADIFSNFKGKTIKAIDLFDKFHTKHLFSRAHYTQALRELVTDGLLSSRFTDNKSHSVSVLISKDCELTFKNG